METFGDCASNIPNIDADGISKWLAKRISYVFRIDYGRFQWNYTESLVPPPVDLPKIPISGQNRNPSWNLIQ